MSRLSFSIDATLVLAFGLWVSIPSLIAGDAVTDTTRVYIGTYDSPLSEGIYRADLNIVTGELSEPVLAVGSANPSFLAIHPNKNYLYAVNEVGDGGVSAYQVDSRSGDLTLINEQPSGGAGACHLVVDRGQKHVVVANYFGGNVSVLPLAQDGRLGTRTCLIQHSSLAASGNKIKAPRCHSINFDQTGRFAFVCDAGLDKVFCYRFDDVSGTLSPNTPPAINVDTAVAPRHFAWHPDRKHGYVINEAALTITVFDYEAKSGGLTATQTVSTVPEGVNRTGYSTAEVVVHPSGKFVYGSNRGHDSIAGFKVNPKNGHLAPLGNFTNHAMEVPRNFNIDPTGQFALVAGQETDNIVVFRIDSETGEFHDTGHSITVGKPVCIKFFLR